MKELINIAKNIKAPGISIYLKEGYFEDTNKAKTISNKIEYLNLKRIVKFAEIHYEADPKQTSILADQVCVCVCVCEREREREREREEREREREPRVPNPGPRVPLFY